MLNTDKEKRLKQLELATALKIREKYDLLEEKEKRKFYSRNRVNAKLLAKCDYFCFDTPAQIAKRYGIPREKLNLWIQEPDDEGRPSWSEQRETEYKNLFQRVIDAKEESCKQIFSLGLHNLKRALLFLTNREQPMSLAEMQKLNSIIVDMNTVLRLEAGKATEIIGNVDTSPEGIQKMLEEMKEIDPYVDYSEEELN